MSNAPGSPDFETPSEFMRRTKVSLTEGATRFALDKAFEADPTAIDTITVVFPNMGMSIEIEGVI